jgi:hypothetical protein
MNDLPNDTPTRVELEALRRQVAALDALVNTLVYDRVEQIGKGKEGFQHQLLDAKSKHLELE